MRLEKVKEEVLEVLDGGQANVGQIQKFARTHPKRLDIVNALDELRKESKVECVSQPVGCKAMKQ